MEYWGRNRLSGNFMGFVMIVGCIGVTWGVLWVGVERVGGKTGLVNDGYVWLVALSDLGLIGMADVWGSTVSRFERFLWVLLLNCGDYFGLLYRFGALNNRPFAVLICCAVIGLGWKFVFVLVESHLLTFKLTHFLIYYQFVSLVNLIRSIISLF